MSTNVTESHATAPTEPPIHSCGCGLKFSLEAWNALPLVAERWDIGGDGIDVVELRNCTCDSTLAREVA
jgi:hypothetical protein